MTHQPVTGDDAAGVAATQDPRRDGEEDPESKLRLVSGQESPDFHPAHNAHSPPLTAPYFLADV